MAPVENTSKKARLTIAQLAAYDDVLTDVLIDHVFAWHKTRKNLGPWQVRNFKHSRGVNEEDITSILFRDVVLAKAPDKALDSLLRMPALRKYVASLASDREKLDFSRHMQKYINIWLPECPFEVSFTNRYMVDQWEARTTARKLVKTGEKIKFLCGNLVSITMDEEEDQSFISNAFSITYSSRKKTPSLFLGPARFANHDCDANAKLESRGGEGMVVIAVRDIEEGDEINVNYGENYFGEDNCECLCSTCEKKGIGGWRYGVNGASGIQTPRAGSESENDEPGSRRSKRRRHAINYNVKIRGQNTVNNEEESQSKRRKVNAESTSMLAIFENHAEDRRSRAPPPIRKPAANEDRKLEKIDPRNASILSQLGRNASPRRESSTRGDARFGFRSRNDISRRSSTPSQRLRSNGLNQPTLAQAKDGTYKSHMLFSFLKGVYLEEDQKPRPSPAQSETVVPSVEVEEPKYQLSSASSDGNSVFDHVERQSATPITEPSAGESRFDKGESIDQAKASTPRPKLCAITQDDGPESSTASQSASIMLEQSPSSFYGPLKLIEAKNEADNRSPKPDGFAATADIETGDRNEGSTSSKTADTPEKEDETKSISPEDEANDDEIGYRTPGDYIRTPRLLGPRNSRWVECRTCEEDFIQLEAHQTRRECPRCERHSKLFGFQWPQTDYERGGPDRVMDHRTVNRFLNRVEEMSEPKRRRIRSDR